MRFTKMHGLGNDYVYIDAAREKVEDAASLARAVSDRHTGVGSDGLILIAPSRSADIRMEMYNADGSRAQMCGNGIRCVAKYAFEHDLVSGERMVIETDAGPREAQCHVDGGVVSSVTVGMGKPVFDPRALPSTLDGERIVDREVAIDGRPFVMTCVSMGNPHAVMFIDGDGAKALAEDGPLVERSPLFPERINAHFVRVDAPDHLTVWTWERGSGATRACGTGACACLVAAAVTGRGQRFATTSLPGGDLLIRWTEEGEVLMTGPAVEVYRGEFATGWSDVPQQPTRVSGSD